jgi:hypothetical protein
MLLFEECGGADCWTDEDVPSFVCEKQRQDLQALLGADYHDFLLAFRDEYQPSRLHPSQLIETRHGHEWTRDHAIFIEKE